MTKVEPTTLPARRRGFTPVAWIAAMALLAVLAALIVGAATHEKPVHEGDPVPVGSGGGTAGELQLSGFTALTGTRWSLMALGNDVSDSMFGNSYGQWQNRNLAFVDRTSGNSFRLLADNTRYVAGGLLFQVGAGPARELDSRGELQFDTRADAAPQPLGWYLAEVAGRPSRQGGIEVVLGSLTERRQAVLLKGNLTVERGWTIDATRLGLLLRRPEGISVAIIDAAAMKVVQETRIEL